MSGRRAPRGLLIAAIGMFLVSVVGLIGSILLNAFAFDRFDAYGEVPIPGSMVLQLPAGDVNVTFHTRALGAPGMSLPIPPLQVTMDPPDWAAEPRLTESIGGTTTINNTDVRQRLWVAHLSSAGDYRVTVNGDVGGYIAPRLAFGHGSPLGWVPWVFAAMLPLALVSTLVAAVWLARTRPTVVSGSVTDWPLSPDFDDPAFASDPAAEFSEASEADPDATSGSRPDHRYVPTDQGIRIQQLKELAALRDSGALTDREFEQEKRRVLDGG